MEKNLGHATAYGYAKSKGYSGTEEEFAQLMADYASVGQSAAQSAEQAAASATSASGSATTASQAAQTATSKASEAVTAADTATTKASEASTSADTASAAATSASTSAQTATTAASTANTKASEASESATAATAAKTDAETARDAAASAASEAAASAASIDPDEFDRKIYAAFATDTATGVIASFPDGADSIPMKDVLVHIEPVQAGSGDPSPDNVRPITGWTGCVISHSGADMTNPTTYSITFPSEAGTVYGGTLDVTKGELVVNKAMVTVDPTMLIARQNGQTKYYFNLVLPDANRTAVVESGTICNILKSGNFSGNPGIWRGNMDACCIRDGGMSFYTDVTKGMEFENALQWLVDNRATVVYPIATPITYHLTPQEITSLLGTNNLWANTGDSEVEYRANTELWVQRKITEAVAAVLNS